jgi:CspA family cold shock protein
MKSSPTATDMANGKIERWIAVRGYGFITPDDGGPNVFAHINSVTDDYEFDDLPVGARVKYEIGDGRKPGTIEAKNIRIIEEGSL